jgi:hypothetical protein
VRFLPDRLPRAGCGRTISAGIEASSKEAVMAAAERIYRRTDAGRKAWESPSSGLPGPYRRILGVITGETHSEVVRGLLRCYSERQLEDWLTEMETLGFIQSLPVTSGHDLDFTGSFSLAALRGQP